MTTVQSSTQAAAAAASNQQSAANDQSDTIQYHPPTNFAGPIGPGGPAYVKSEVDFQRLVCLVHLDLEKIGLKQLKHENESDHNITSSILDDNDDFCSLSKPNEFLMIIALGDDDEILQSFNYFVRNNHRK